MKTTDQTTTSKSLSFADVIESIKTLKRRFPAALAYMAVAYAAVALATFDLYQEPFYVAYFGLFGALASFAMYLWTEHKPKISKNIAQAVVFVLVTSDLIYNYVCNTNQYESVMVTRLITVISLTVMILTGYRATDPDVRWNLSFKMLKNLIAAVFIGLISICCCLLIFIMTEFLLDINSARPAILAGITVGIFMPSLIFMAISPTADGSSTSRLPSMSCLESITVRFIFLPLLASGIFTLYAYTLDSLITFTMPRTSAATFVTIFLFGFLGVIYLLYPLVPGNKTMHRIVTWLPVAGLLPTIMMSVAVIYRICEHGFTGARLYMLTLNLWSYYALFMLWRSNGKSILKVITSLAIWLLAVTVIPGFNYFSIDKSREQKELEELPIID